MSPRSSNGRSGRNGDRRRSAEQRWSGGRITRETPFALAEVIPEGGRPWRRLLRLDGEDCSHVDLRDPTDIDFSYVRRFADMADLLAPPGAPLDVLHLGGGGFTLPRYIAATRPGSRSEVAEIDPGLVALAKEELDLRPNRELKIRIADARAVLGRRRAESADLVVLDVFRGTETPPHLLTVESVHAADRALRPGGVFAANAIDVPPIDAARTFAAAVAEVFPELALIATRKVVRGRQGGNLVILGAHEPLPIAELRRRALSGPVPEVLVAGAELTAWIGGARPEHDPPEAEQEDPASVEAPTPAGRPR